MKIFLDSADIGEIRELASTKLIDGVTTNPSLAAKSGKPFAKLIEEICDIVPGPVSAEVISLNADEMISEGQYLSKIAPNVTIKVPLTVDGLKACYALSHDSIMVNVTLCFSTNQALLAAKAGATFISPFCGRLDDISQDGMDLIADIRRVYDNYHQLNTEILAASIRHPQHVLAVARLGADVATLPGKVFQQLYRHPLTDLGIQQFMADWQAAGLTIR